MNTLNKEDIAKRIDEVAMYLYTIYELDDVYENYAIGAISFGSDPKDWGCIISFLDNGRILISRALDWSIDDPIGMYTYHTTQDMINFLKVFLVQDK